MTELFASWWCREKRTITHLGLSTVDMNIAVQLFYEGGKTGIILNILFFGAIAAAVAKSFRDKISVCTICGGLKRISGQK